MSSCEFVQESEDARLSTRLYLDRCRSTARQLNLKVEKLGDNNEWGWQRAARSPPCAGGARPWPAGPVAPEPMEYEVKSGADFMAGRLRAEEVLLGDEPARLQGQMGLPTVGVQKKMNGR